MLISPIVCICNVCAYVCMCVCVCLYKGADKDYNRNSKVTEKSVPLLQVTYFRYLG